MFIVKLNNEAVETLNNSVVNKAEGLRGRSAF
jgi:hypothetical protein